jgi:hypothetical protein
LKPRRETIVRKRLIVAGSAAALLAIGGTGAALAVSGNDGDSSISGPNADKAVAAALKANGGGTANSVEQDGEDGATYGVEVRNHDGSTVDVRLDAAFKVVAIEPDSEQADTPEPGDTPDQADTPETPGDPVD